MTGETEARFAGTNHTLCIEFAQVVAYITDSLAIRQILDPGPQSPDKPPPEIGHVVRVTVDEEGREIELQPA